MDEQSPAFWPVDALSPAEQFERQHVFPARGRALIVGSHVYHDKEDRRARYPEVVGVDMIAGPGVDIVANLEDPLLGSLSLMHRSFAHVECLSVLEHSRKPWRLAENLQRLMRPGATIHVQAPFIWRPHQYPSDMWRFTIEGIRELFPRIKWRAMCYAHRGLTVKNKLDVIEVDGRPYFARTEVCAFGELAA